jgi:hypothetical protein
MEFLYNNFIYILTGISPFFVLLKYYLKINNFIKDDIQKREIFIIRERTESIIIIRINVIKRLRNIIEY